VKDSEMQNLLLSRDAAQEIADDLFEQKNRAAAACAESGHASVLLIDFAAEWLAAAKDLADIERKIREWYGVPKMEDGS